MSKELTEIPKATASDAVHTFIKSALSIIPYAGSPASELFAAIVTPPLNKRKDEWVQSIAGELIKLDEKVNDFSFEKLSQDEHFITVVLQATQIALRSHQKEKLEALKNAVVNVAKESAPNEDKQLMYLNIIDSLTPWHIKLLLFFRNPADYVPSGSMGMGALSQLIERAFPELRGEEEFYFQLTRDVYTRGLIKMENNILNTTMTDNGLFENRVSDMGDEFLEFISK